MDFDQQAFVHKAEMVSQDGWPGGAAHGVKRKVCPAQHAPRLWACVRKQDDKEDHNDDDICDATENKNEWWNPPVRWPVWSSPPVELLKCVEVPAPMSILPKMAMSSKGESFECRMKQKKRRKIKKSQETKKK